MTTLAHQVIELGIKLRMDGKLVERASFAQLATPDKLSECIQIWQDFIAQPAKTQQNQLNSKLTESLQIAFSDIIQQIEQHTLLAQRHAEARLESVNLALNEYKSESFAQQAELTQQLRELKQQVNEYKQTLAQKEQNYDLLFNQAEQSRHLLDQKEEENRTLWRKLGEQINQTDELKVQLAESHSEQQTSQQGIKRQFKQTEDELIKQLKQKSQLLDEQYQQTRDAEQENRHLSETLAKVRQELSHKIVDLTNDKNAFEQLFNQEKDKNAAADKILVETNKQHHQQLQKLQGEIKQQKSTHLILTEQYETLQQQYNELVQQQDKQHQTIQLKLRESQLKLSELNQELNIKTALLLESEEQNNQLHNQFRSQFDQLEQNHKRKNEELTYQVADLQKRNNQLEDKIDELKQTHESQQQQQQQLLLQVEQDYQDIKSVLNHTDQELSKAKKKYQELAFERDNKQQEIAALQAKTQQQQLKYQKDDVHAREIIKSLRDELQQLTQNYQQLQHDNQEQLTEYKLKFEYAQQQLLKLSDTEDS